MSRKGSIYFILLAAMMVLLSGSELSAQCNEFYIYGSPASASCKEAVEDVVWINASSSVHNTIAGNTLTKFNSNNNWDGNGFSYQSVADGGYMQTSVIETNKLLRKSSVRAKLEHPPLYKPKKQKKSIMNRLNGGN